MGKIEKLYSAKEAAKILNMSVFSLKEKLRTGIYKGVQIGNRWKVAEGELKKIISGGTDGNKQDTSR